MYLDFDCLFWTKNQLDDLFVEKIMHNHKLKTFKEKEIIYWQGKNNNYFYLLLEGLVEISMITSNGRKKIIHIHEPRCFFGETILDGKPNHLTATCLTPVKVIAINKDEVINSNDKELWFKIILSFCAKNRNMVKLIEEQGFKEIDERVEDLLEVLSYKLGMNYPNDYIYVKIPLTHQLIADFVGASRVRISQIIRKMTKEGRLHLKRKYFIFYNKDHHNINKSYKAL